MTDKQIIIDGIDVSECINFRPDVDTTQVSYTNACSIGIWQRWYSNLEPSCIMSCSCKYNPNCYYKQLKRKEQECEELKKQLESTKGLVTVGNRQLKEALLELQKYKDREQWEIELNKKRADSFKEMRRMLYGKVEGSSLIKKRNPYEN